VSGFKFFSFDPPRDLAPFVEAIWGVRGLAGYTTEAVLPSGAVELMVNFGPPMSWSRLAHDFGYADQSHLIREFKRLGSVTPTEFLARRSADSTAVVID